MPVFKRISLILFVVCTISSGFCIYATPEEYLDNAPNSTAETQKQEPDYCPPDMLIIPEGDIQISRNDIELISSADKTSLQHVSSFCIDKSRVRIKELEKKVPTDNNDEQEPKEEFDFDYLPAFQTTYYDAQTFCEKQGKRLPSDAEWQRAIDDTQGTIIPLADENIQHFFGRCGPFLDTDLEEESAPIDDVCLTTIFFIGSLIQSVPQEFIEPLYGLIQNPELLYEWSDSCYFEKKKAGSSLQHGVVYGDISLGKYHVSPKYGCINRVVRGARFTDESKTHRAFVRAGLSVERGYAGFRCVQDNVLTEISLKRSFDMCNEALAYVSSLSDQYVWSQNAGYSDVGKNFNVLAPYFDQDVIRNTCDQCEFTVEHYLNKYCMPGSFEFNLLLDEQLFEISARSYLSGCTIRFSMIDHALFSDCLIESNFQHESTGREISYSNNKNSPSRGSF